MVVTSHNPAALSLFPLPHHALRAYLCAAHMKPDKTQRKGFVIIVGH